MSRTDRRGGTSSPITKYVTFSGQTGLFSYYDKDDEQNVELESLELVYLDSRYSITGWNEKAGAKLRSNLVSNLSREKLKVSTTTNKNARVSHDIAEGLYKDIKDTIKAANGKFTTNLFCLANINDKWEVINLQLSGIASGNWIDFSNEYPNESYADYLLILSKGSLSKRGTKNNTIEVTKEEEEELVKALKKNPRMKQPVWFYTMNIEVDDLNKDVAELADEADIRLSEYLRGVSSKVETSKEDLPSQQDLPNTDDGEDDDDLPF